jgi:hypothetical protein
LGFVWLPPVRKWLVGGCDVRFRSIHMDLSLAASVSVHKRNVYPADARVLASANSIFFRTGSPSGGRDALPLRSGFRPLGLLSPRLAGARFASDLELFADVLLPRRVLRTASRYYMTSAQLSFLSSELFSAPGFRRQRMLEVRQRYYITRCTVNVLEVKRILRIAKGCERFCLMSL